MTTTLPTCDACNAPATFFAETVFGTMNVCCEKHRQGAIDRVLDHDEDDCQPVPHCNCEAVAMDRYARRPLGKALVVPHPGDLDPLDDETPCEHGLEYPCAAIAPVICNASGCGYFDTDEHEAPTLCAKHSGDAELAALVALGAMPDEPMMVGAEREAWLNKYGSGDAG